MWKTTHKCSSHHMWQRIQPGLNKWLPPKVSGVLYQGKIERTEYEILNVTMDCYIP